MKARLYAILFAALSVTGFSTAVLADNDSNNVSWKRVIGIIQAGNLVGNIQGGGQPWSTLGGEAHVNLRSGHLEFEVRGLVLAGGNSIGTPDAINQVRGTIVCGPATPPALPLFVADTPLVPLSAQGDAEFEGNVGPFPSACTPTSYFWSGSRPAAGLLTAPSDQHPERHCRLALRSPAGSGGAFSFALHAG